MTFKLPSEISCVRDANQYIFRHKTMGELGKLVVTGLGKNTHFATFVSGEPEDPYTEERRKRLEPITNAMIAEVEKQTNSREIGIDAKSFTPKVRNKIHQITAKHIPCSKCNKIVGHLIFADDAENEAMFEDYYRIAYLKIKEFNVPTWIIGKEKINSPRNIISHTKKVWPEKEDAIKMDFERFNAILDHLHFNHCN